MSFSLSFRLCLFHHLSLSTFPTHVPPPLRKRKREEREKEEEKEKKSVRNRRPKMASAMFTSRGPEMLNPIKRLGRIREAARRFIRHSSVAGGKLFQDLSDPIFYFA